MPKDNEPKNQSLPGLGRKKIRALEKLAADLRDAQEREAAAKKDIKEAKIKIADKMHVKGMDAYQCDDIDFMIELVPKDEQVKLSKSIPEEEASVVEND